MFVVVVSPETVGDPPYVGLPDATILDTVRPFDESVRAVHFESAARSLAMAEPSVATCIL